MRKLCVSQDGTKTAGRVRGWHVRGRCSDPEIRDFGRFRPDLSEARLVLIKTALTTPVSGVLGMWPVCR